MQGSTLLLDSHAVAAATASRLIELLYVAVRYLAQGHSGLVQEVLHERSLRLKNQSYLAQLLSSVMPIA